MEPPAKKPKLELKKPRSPMEKIGNGANGAPNGTKSSAKERETGTETGNENANQNPAVKVPVNANQNGARTSSGPTSNANQNPTGNQNTVAQFNVAPEAEVYVNGQNFTYMSLEGIDRKKIANERDCWPEFVARKKSEFLTVIGATQCQRNMPMKEKNFSKKTSSDGTEITPEGGSTDVNLEGGSTDVNLEGGSTDVSPEEGHVEGSLNQDTNPEGVPKREGTNGDTADDEYYRSKTQKDFLKMRIETVIENLHGYLEDIVTAMMYEYISVVNALELILFIIEEANIPGVSQTKKKEILGGILFITVSTIPDTCFSAGSTKKETRFEKLCGLLVQNDVFHREKIANMMELDALPSQIGAKDGLTRKKNQYRTKDRFTHLRYNTLKENPGGYATLKVMIRQLLQLSLNISCATRTSGVTPTVKRQAELHEKSATEEKTPNRSANEKPAKGGKIPNQRGDDTERNTPKIGTNEEMPSEMPAASGTTDSREKLARTIHQKITQARQQIAGTGKMAAAAKMVGVTKMMGAAHRTRSIGYQDLPKPVKEAELVERIHGHIAANCLDRSRVCSMILDFLSEILNSWNLPIEIVALDLQRRLSVGSEGTDRLSEAKSNSMGNMKGIVKSNIGRSMKSNAKTKNVGNMRTHARIDANPETNVNTTNATMGTSATNGSVGNNGCTTVIMDANGGKLGEVGPASDVDASNKSLKDQYPGTRGNEASYAVRIPHVFQSTLPVVPSTFYGRSLLCRVVGTCVGLLVKVIPLNRVYDVVYYRMNALYKIKLPQLKEKIRKLEEQIEGHTQLVETSWNSVQTSVQSLNDAYREFHRHDDDRRRRGERDRRRAEESAQKIKKMAKDTFREMSTQWEESVRALPRLKSERHVAIEELLSLQENAIDYRVLSLLVHCGVIPEERIYPNIPSIVKTLGTISIDTSCVANRSSKITTEERKSDEGKKPNEIKSRDEKSKVGMYAKDDRAFLLDDMSKDHLEDDAEAIRMEFKRLDEAVQTSIGQINGISRTPEKEHAYWTRLHGVNSINSPNIRYIASLLSINAWSRAYTLMEKLVGCSDLGSDLARAGQIQMLRRELVNLLLWVLDPLIRHYHLDRRWETYAPILQSSVPSVPHSSLDFKLEANGSTSNPTIPGFNGCTLGVTAGIDGSGLGPGNKIDGPHSNLPNVMAEQIIAGERQIPMSQSLAAGYDERFQSFLRYFDVDLLQSHIETCGNSGEQQLKVRPSDGASTKAKSSGTSGKTSTKKAFSEVDTKSKVVPSEAAAKKPAVATGVANGIPEMSKDDPDREAAKQNGKALKRKKPSRNASIETNPPFQSFNVHGAGCNSHAPNSTSGLRQCYDVSHFLISIQPIIRFLENSLHREKYVLEILWKLVRIYINECSRQTPRNPRNRAGIFEKNNQNSRSCNRKEKGRRGTTEAKERGTGKLPSEQVISLIVGTLLPASSQMHPDLPDQVLCLIWGTLSELPTSVRWRIYGDWQNMYECKPQLQLMGKITEKRIQNTLKRATGAGAGNTANSDSSLLGVMRQFHMSRLADSNPVPFAKTILTQISFASNDNLIVPILAMMKKLSFFVCDVVCWAIMSQCFEKAKKSGGSLMAPGGVHLQGWLQNLSKFTSLFFATHVDADLHTVLYTVADFIENHALEGMTSLTFGRSLMQVLVNDLISDMGEWAYVTDLSAQQLECLAGGIQLKTEVIFSQNSQFKSSDLITRDERAKLILLDVFRNTDLVPRLWRSLALMRKAATADKGLTETLRMMAGKSDPSSDLKKVGFIYDISHEGLVSLTEFVGNSLSSEDYVRLLPSYAEVFANFDPGVAFMMLRPSLPVYGTLTEERKTHVIKQIFDNPTFIDLKKQPWINASYRLAFWRLELSDLVLCCAHYESQIKALDQKIVDDGRTNTRSDAHERRRLLKDEYKVQEARVARTMQMLEKEKITWFRNHSENLTQALVTEFIAKRFLLSFHDALFCAHWLYLMMRNKTPGFSFSQIGSRVIETCVAMLPAMTEKESRILGVFCCKFLMKMHELVKDSSIYQGYNPCIEKFYYDLQFLKKHGEDDKTEDNNSSRRDSNTHANMRDNNTHDGDRREKAEDKVEDKAEEGDVLDKVEYHTSDNLRWILFEWEKTLWIGVRKCLKSNDWMDRRNSLNFVSAIKTIFPLTNTVGQRMLKSLKNIEMHETRRDLELFARSLHNAYNALSKNWKDEEGANPAYVKPVKEEPAPNNPPKDVAAADAVKESLKDGLVSPVKFVDKEELQTNIVGNTTAKDPLIKDDGKTDAVPQSSIKEPAVKNGENGAIKESLKDGENGETTNNSNEQNLEDTELGIN